MPKPFFSHLHFSKSANLPGFKNIPVSLWPKEWSQLHFKSYPRMRRIRLPTPRRLTKNLGKVLLTRSSRRDFQRHPISLTQLSDLLYWCAGLQPYRPSLQLLPRMYPSAGGLYPLEIYPLVLRGPISKGLYHYNVLQHSLELLWEKDFTKEISRAFITPEPQRASVILLISAVFERNQNKYRERGYRYIFLEAGHLGQNIYLVSKSLGIKCLAMGGFVDPLANKLVDIDGIHEAIIYTVIVGR